MRSLDDETSNKKFESISSNVFVSLFVFFDSDFGLQTKFAVTD